MSLRWALASLMIWAVYACGDDASPQPNQPGELDASRAPLDAATRDASPSIDAQVNDAGSADAAPRDAAASVDATLDHAPPDASISVPAPEPSGCITDVTAGTHQVACDGITHQLTVAPACLSTQCGLIIDVHGGTMSAQMEDKNTQLSKLAPPHGFVVLQPSAAGGLWNAATDDAKVLAFIQTLIGVFHLDEKRVHMTGLSQGGYMTWRFICQHGELLASAAPAAAAGTANISIEVDCSFTGDDKPTVELPVLYMHGTTDGLVDFAHALTKRDAVVATWSMGAGTALVTDPTYRRTRYQNARGTVFEFIDHDYQSSSVFPAAPPFGVALKGHCFPGSDDLMVTEAGQLMSFGCNPPTDFTWGEQVLAFFLAHPKP